MNSTKQQVSEAKKATEGAPLDGLLRERSMEKTWLIQRLLIPNPDHRENPFEFGAGYRRGGLSKKAYAMANQVFNFDYMGAAEYEWGAIPDSLSKILEMEKQHEIITGVVKLEEGDVFYLCSAAIEKGVKEAVKRAAHGGIRTRDYVGLREALKNKERKIGDLAGWLELDNHFMFFVDTEMFLKSAGLFGTGLTARAGQTLAKAANET